MSINELKERVHRKIDYSAYASTNVRNGTNCYSHALGSTLPHSPLYRVGAICGKKNIHDQYCSTKEVEELFLKDMETLGLKVIKMNIISDEDVKFVRDDTLRRIKKYELKENEHIVLLFVNVLADGSILDFHFWRYDEKGFTEKRWERSVTFIDDPKVSWPVGMMTKICGVYVVER